MSSDTLAPPPTEVHPVAASLRHGNTFRLMAATSTALIGMGLVMILSASSVEAFKTYGSSFLFFRKQLMGAALGLVALRDNRKAEILIPRGYPLYPSRIVLVGRGLIER